MNYKSSLSELSTFIERLQERQHRSNEEVLSIKKTLYAVRQLLEREYEIIDKVKTPISESERISRALALLKPLTPHGPNWTVDQ